MTKNGFKLNFPKGRRFSYRIWVSDEKLAEDLLVLLGNYGERKNNKVIIIRICYKNSNAVRNIIKKIIKEHPEISYDLYLDFIPKRAKDKFIFPDYIIKSIKELGGKVLFAYTVWRDKMVS